MSTSLVHLEPPTILKLLAHDVRWQLLALLAQSDYRVNELSALLQKPLNLVSYHLRLLRSEAIVHERRSSADARDVYYSLDFPEFQRLYKFAGESLHPAFGGAQPAGADRPTATAGSPLRVLFLCTHNSARSQMAEGLLRHLGGPGIEVFSAGNQPATVHPHAIRAMAELGIDISSQRSKHVDEFLGQSFDLVITVCDRVRENCPVFPDDPEHVHWSIPDPLAADADTDGTLPEQVPVTEGALPMPAPVDAYPLFATVARELRTRVTYLLLAQQNRGEKAPRSSHSDRQRQGAKAKVLFLCTGNSARSQMAEAFMRKYAGDRYEIHSAGLNPKGMNPYTIRVMAEVGLDLSAQWSKDVSEYLGRTNFAYLFTVCARGEADCPTSFLNSGGERIEWDFADPVAFAGTDEEKLAQFRVIRDQIDQQIRAWLAARNELN